jgi:diacylglycerol kinase (ATP)
MTESALLIVNPIAGRGRGQRVLARLEQGLRDAGVHTEVSVTRCAGDARRAACELGAGRDVVVAVGGDGTLNEVINGVPSGCAVTQFPLGTGNVLAKELSLPRGAGRFCRMVREGRQRLLDLGTAAGRRFVSFVGIGFDAAITAAMESKRQGAIRMVHYVPSILRESVRWRFPRIEVSVDGGDPVAAGGFALVSSVRSYGGPLRPVPQAVHNDGLLDVCILPKGTRLSYLRAFFAFLLGCARACSGARYFRGRKCHATSDERVPYHLDGDTAGHLPVTIELLSEQLPVIIP